MRTYLFALVLTAESGQDEAKTKKFVDALVTKAEGKVTGASMLGLKEMAYKIKGKTSGWYGFFTVEIEADKVKSLDSEAKVNTQVLRYLLIAK